MDIDFIVNNAIKNNTIKQSELKIDLDDTHIMHRGIEITPGDISVLITDPPEASFLYVKCPSDKKVYFYLADDDISELLEDLGYHDKTGNEIKGINMENKKYCVELTVNEYNYIYINFITTLPSGCANKFCKRLNGLFAAIQIFLKRLNYTGPISLKDDARIGEKSLVMTRLSEGKKEMSIYEKYGFSMSLERHQDIIDAYKSQNKEKLQLLTNNIPMIAKDASKFNQC